MARTRKQSLLFNILIVCLFILLSFLSIVLLLYKHYLFGAGDMQFHLKRIIDLEESFKHGNPLPQFSFNQFHGSAVFSLYPYLNLLPIVALSLIIKSNIALIYINFAFNELISLLTSYFGSLKFSKSKKTSLLFSVVYSLSIPFLTYGFYNMDLGVLTSISAFPLVVFGIFNLLKNNKWLELFIGLTIVIYSHVLSTFIIVGLVLLILIINLRSINKKILINLFKTILFTLLFTSLIWVPALSLILNNFGNLYPPNPGSLVGTSFLTLFKSSALNHITYSISSLSLIGLVIPLIFYKSFYTKFNNYTKQMYWIALVLIFVCSNLFPWVISNYSVFKLLKIFQFTWRFYVIPELLLSYIFSICIAKCITRSNIKVFIIIIIIIYTIIIQFSGQSQLIHESIHAPLFTSKYVHKRTYSRNTYFYQAGLYHINLNLDQCHISYRKKPGYPYYKIKNNNQLHRLVNTYTDENRPDYIPIKSLPYLNGINNYQGEYGYNKYIHLYHDGYNRYVFNNKKHLSKLILPILDYNNDKLNVYLDNHLITYHNSNNLITINDVMNGTHKIKIQYKPTLLSLFLKWLLFIIGVIGLCYMYISRFLLNKIHYK